MVGHQYNSRSTKGRGFSLTDTYMLGEELKKLGYLYYSGVPCSYLKDLINYAINDCEYVIAANEGDAVASCAGAYLAGTKSVFLCQNSGLTNAVSPLTSLNHIFKIPVLGFVSLRGEPGRPDEPQHELMGEITPALLELMKIEWEYLSGNDADIRRQLQKADAVIRNNRSFFFIVKKGTLTEVSLRKQPSKRTGQKHKTGRVKPDSLPSRAAVLTRLNGLKDSKTMLIATTGKTGRELYEIEDAPSNFYMVGSMGCASPLALGLAQVAPRLRVIAIDGDGAALMRLGSLATNGYYAPRNMLHLILDNNAYDSTGGQTTVSNNVDFIELAAAAGYPNAFYLHDLNELEMRIREWRQQQGLTLLYLKITGGSRDNLGRPQVKPYEVKERLMAFIANQPTASAEET
jgi:phosphonopyruvate decarboxylase